MTHFRTRFTFAATLTQVFSVGLEYNVLFHSEVVLARPRFSLNFCSALNDSPGPNEVVLVAMD